LEGLLTTKKCGEAQAAYLKTTCRYIVPVLHATIQGVPLRSIGDAVLELLQVTVVTAGFEDLVAGLLIHATLRYVNSIQSV
jgi:hypothetical protein